MGGEYSITTTGDYWITADIRGLLAEFGVALPLKAEVVRREAAGKAEALPGYGKTVIEDLLAEVRHLDERIKQYDVHVRAMAKDSTPAQQLMQILGIGEVTASARRQHAWLTMGSPACVFHQGRAASNRSAR